MLLAPWHTTRVQIRIQVFGLPYLCPRLSFLLTVKTSEKNFYQRKLATYFMSRCAVGQSREQKCLESVHLHPIVDSVVLGW